MNGQKPTDLDLSPLHGQEVLSFVVGKNHLELVFTDTRLTIEGGLEICLPGLAARVYEKAEMHKASGELPLLLGQTVEQARWSEEKGLALLFSNHAKVTALLADGGFESFSFSLPHIAGIIVV